MVHSPLRLKGREVAPRKAIMSPKFGAKTVLTNSPWNFVSLWLKRNRKEESLLYWEQAQQFWRASIGLPIQSSPLLLYYSYMNAAKALLSTKGVQFSPMHGVRGQNPPGARRKISLSNETVRITTNGIVPSLATYFGESDPVRTYSMKELFFNSTFIHRTYCLTYRSQQEMFLALRICRYVFDTNNKVVFLEGQFASDIVRTKIKNSLPSTLTWLDFKNKRFRSTAQIPWKSATRAKDSELAALARLHSELRFDLHYINGSQPLWYIKLKTPGPRRILRRGPTLTLCAMHRLSEICRYRPIELSSYLEGQQNWLLSEFAAMSPEQYFDEIACEITGEQFLIPNIRAPI
jgi:hypothetical protein